jgi:hypothetical protein
MVFGEQHGAINPQEEKKVVRVEGGSSMEIN